jgi:integrase
MPAYRDGDVWRYRRKGVPVPDGRRVSISGTPAINTKAAAEAAERAHIARTLNPPPAPAKEAPTFNEFADEFERTYVKSNNKPSEQVAKRCSLSKHLRPALGEKHLDEIGARDIEALKARMLDAELKPKTVNNTLTILGKLLSYAVEVGAIERAPKAKLLRVPPQKFDFLDFAEYTRLSDAARPEPEWYAAVVVGAEAGLRRGEILALQWEDVDLVARTLTVRHSEYLGKLVSPKGNKHRTIPLTARLAAGLKAIRHLRGPFVFCDADGEMLTREVMRWNLPRLCRKAGLRPVGWHGLRHSFCSHLAMRGVPPKAIQELAGHASLTTTMRYMHLAPSTLRTAIDTLESGCAWTTTGQEKPAKDAAEPNC